MINQLVFSLGFASFSSSASTLMLGKPNNSNGHNYSDSLEWIRDNQTRHVGVTVKLALMGGYN
ncbi:hypothetical protein O6H91_10G100100 [Diphasiastrum complanatum]|uniref:Uncharacterized protein n=1 Tax=Diphasiastrum complanatum TaxID=34168 RepID=A0ACC2CJX7_DIPCM|nr:hypothetical protein O6H91_10G100100 [Diphasiastrum complanatum]